MQILTAMRKICSLGIAACGMLLLLTGLCSCSKDRDALTEDTAGTGGSLARFTIALNHLYAVDHQLLYTFSLADARNPVKVFTNEVGFDVETIYTWKDKLFIGSGTAMYVYSIADPGRPSLLGTALHTRACDPVVANDSVAYVTVRSGSNCGGNVNALYVYDLKDVLQPRQANVINLQNPYGLGLKDSTLYVCDAAYGLKVFRISEAYYPLLVSTVTGETFYDCIPYGNLLICMIEGGMALYDISDPAHIKLEAKIRE